MSVPVPNLSPSRRSERGAVAYCSGLAAESIVERDYQARGYNLVVARWRGSAGEIDLILQHGDETVFVEVKKAKDFARAAERISPRQMQRIAQSAEDYLSKLPQGRLSLMRIDVALVNQTGQVEVIENAFGA
ncbi:YraN family protein [Lentibacter algarum]|uniref:YraN family protein n=1 Tax=Lentibacter algarum TaxID=576131 RepID=UPI001C083123|nr:YraN family protein [Lentibacter algarum]MBU2983500.1 YraN family protein [Lentibacter algarum]